MLGSQACMYINFEALPACPIINQEPLDRFASKFDCGTRENHGNVLSLRFSVEWVHIYMGK